MVEIVVATSLQAYQKPHRYLGWIVLYLCYSDDEGGYKLEPFIAWSNAVRPMHTPLAFSRQEQIDYLPSLLEKHPFLISRLEEAIDCPRSSVKRTTSSLCAILISRLLLPIVRYLHIWRTAAIVGVQIEKKSPVLFGN